MANAHIDRIEQAARQMRILQAEMSRCFACYIGSSLSATDIVATLYFSVLNVDSSRPDDPQRDMFIMSKGHGSPALYAALHLRGYIDKQSLLGHSTVNSPVYYHPNAKVPGVELTTGSLGHGLNFSLGTALAQRIDGYASRTFVLLGDGELNEGSNWEAIMRAPSLGLGNLVAIVDRNGRQANSRTEDLVPLEDIEAKWKAFNWRTRVVDGHSLVQLHEALLAPAAPQDKPLVVIAKTIRGKGVSFLEDKKEAWLWQLSDDEYARAIGELRGDAVDPDEPFALRRGGSVE